MIHDRCQIYLAFFCVGDLRRSVGGFLSGFFTASLQFGDDAVSFRIGLHGFGLGQISGIGRVKVYPAMCGGVFNDVAQIPVLIF